MSAAGAERCVLDHLSIEASHARFMARIRGKHEAFVWNAKAGHLDALRDDVTHASEPCQKYLRLLSAIAVGRGCREHENYLYELMRRQCAKDQ